MASSGSDSAYQTASKWMEECSRDHRLCFNPSNILPTRVIDVGRHDAGDTRLVICDGHRGQWVILSHCWGSQRHGITTTENLEDRQRRIDVDSLPILYQDASQLRESSAINIYGLIPCVSSKIPCWTGASSSSQGVFSSSDELRDRSKPILTLNCYTTLHQVDVTMQIWKLHPYSYENNVLEYLLYQRAWAL